MMRGLSGGIEGRRWWRGGLGIVGWWWLRGSGLGLVGLGWWWGLGW